MLKFWHCSSTLFYPYFVSINFKLYNSATALAMAGDEIAVSGDFL